jgi:hypothetical protein
LAVDLNNPVYCGYYKFGLSEVGIAGRGLFSHEIGPAHKDLDHREKKYK